MLTTLMQKVEAKLWPSISCGVDHTQWARIRMNRMNQGPLRYGVQPLVKFCRPVSYLGLMPFNFIWKKKPLTKFWSPAHQVQVSASEAT